MDTVTQTAHTPGKLIVDLTALWTEDGDRFVATCRSAAHPITESEANARRMVALWNAAVDLGLTTDAIEAGALQDLVRVARDALVATTVEEGRHDYCEYCGRAQGHNGGCWVPGAQTALARFGVVS